MNRYRCKHCKQTVERDSDKAWITSECVRTGQTVRLVKQVEFPGRRIKTHRKTKPPQRLPANIAMADAFMGIFGFKRVGAK